MADNKSEYTLDVAMAELDSYVSENSNKKSTLPKEENVHHNHRQRVDRKVEEYGFENLPEHEQLEFLLFVTIPRRDTNPLAHRLLNEFGTLQGVLNADCDELQNVNGIGYRTAKFLSQLNRVAGVIVRNQHDCEYILDTYEKIKWYISTYYYGRLTEHSYIFLLDANNRLKRTVKLSDGINDQTHIYPQKVAQKALLNDANAVIIAHNHPGGTLEPSEEDIEITRRIETTLKAVGVRLHDSVIISGNDCFSFKENGYLTSLRWISK